MHPYPHQYIATAHGIADGLTVAGSPGLADIACAPPPQFDGPEGQWSPETLLLAAVADCFILTFRAIARASKLEWTALSCRVEGTLERVGNQSRFTRYVTHAQLTLPAGDDANRATLLLEKAEAGCLVANSLNGERVLNASVSVAA